MHHDGVGILQDRQHVDQYHDVRTTFVFQQEVRDGLDFVLCNLGIVLNGYLGAPIWGRRLQAGDDVPVVGDDQLEHVHVELNELRLGGLNVRLEAVVIRQGLSRLSDCHAFIDPVSIFLADAIECSTDIGGVAAHWCIAFFLTFVMAHARRQTNIDMADSVRLDSGP